MFFRFDVGFKITQRQFFLQNVFILIGQHVKQCFLAEDANQTPILQHRNVTEISCDHPVYDGLQTLIQGGCSHCVQRD
ncbi:hypothetical protein SDC9_200874 [bioreactor metagenome]|uniref:Uncharacterized protein n=1 Tax=bioreactor metagenome TaxID=1076179 RepID=A0A645IQA0_9ZZZZ